MSSDRIGGAALQLVVLVVVDRRKVPSQSRG